jgi:hypothetical protein
VVQRGFEDKTRLEEKRRREKVHRGDECDLTNHRVIANSRSQIGQSFRYTAFSRALLWIMGQISRWPTLVANPLCRGREGA